MRNLRVPWTLGLVLTMAACGGQRVDLGGGDGGSGEGAGGGEGGGSSGGSSPLSGIYKGYIESFKFPDGSDTVVMTLAFAADGTVSGTIFFGDGAPLAPPTDPEVGYPPGLESQNQPTLPDGLFEGFAFTIFAGTFASPRLTVGLDPAELWTQWCGLQTAYPQYNGQAEGGAGCGPLLSYGCLPNVGWQGGTDGCSWMSCDSPAFTPIDCGKLALCARSVDPVLNPPCTCTATACTVIPPKTPGVTFDMQLASGALDGSESGIGTSLGGSSVLNVHLTKQP